MQYGFLQQLIVFTCNQKQMLNNKMHVPCQVQIELWMLFFGYVITLNGVTHNYQVKHWLI